MAAPHGQVELDSNEHRVVQCTLHSSASMLHFSASDYCLINVHVDCQQWQHCHAHYHTIESLSLSLLICLGTFVLAGLGLLRAKHYILYVQMENFNVATNFIRNLTNSILHDASHFSLSNFDRSVLG